MAAFAHLLLLGALHGAAAFHCAANARPGLRGLARSTQPVANSPFDDVGKAFEGFFGGGKEKKEAPAKSDGGDADFELAFRDPESWTPEEERKVKLELSANYRPRTSTVKGEGYQFFQGPTPLTGEQEGMADFLSKENFQEAGSLSIVQKGILGVAVLGVLALLVALITL